MNYLNLNNKPLPVLLGMVHRLVERKFMQTVSQSGYNLSLDQWMVLMPIWKHNGIAQHKIVSNCPKDKTSVARIITTLEKKNIVIRVKSQFDQRVNHIHLTKLGEAMFDKITPLMEETRMQVRKDIPDEDIKTTQTVLIQMIQNLEGKNG